MRYGAICKSLHVLPRMGGVLDQPYDEIVRLEKILDAFGQYEEYERKKSESRNKMRSKSRSTTERIHAPEGPLT